MTEIFGLETGLDFSVGGLSGFAVYLAWIFGFIVLAIIAGVIIWWQNQKKLYREEVVVFENLSGKGWVVVMKDKARRLRLSKDGTEILYLKKKKMPLSAYGKKMGTNQYWFAIGPDGGWYNFVLGDLDAKMGILDIELIDRDIKLLTVAMLKQAQEEYGPKQSFMDKWGVWVFSIIWVILGIAGASYLISQLGEVANQLTSGLNVQGETIKILNEILGRLDTMCSGGSGLKTAI
jgi:hypothetical protein